MDDDWDSVRFDLMRIRDLLLQRKGALVNLTADGRTLSAVRPHLDSFLSSLPADSADSVSWANTLMPLNEAITVPTQVRHHTFSSGRIFAYSKSLCTEHCASSCCIHASAECPMSAARASLLDVHKS